MTKNQIISARILAQVAAGLSVRDAIDAVLGAGTYEQLADDLWEALREKAAAH